MQRVTGQHSAGAPGLARLRAPSPRHELNRKGKACTLRSLLRRDTDFLRTNDTNRSGARSRAAWMVTTSRAPFRARGCLWPGRTPAVCARVELELDGRR